MTDRGGPRVELLGVEALGVEPLGEGALRVTLPADVDRAATLARLAALDGVRDVVLAEAHCAVYFDGAPPADPAAAVVRGAAGPTGRLTTIHARYDGPDLERVAAWAGVTVDEVILRHSGRVYEVRYLGFVPGFAYLADVCPSIAAPRLPSPRPRVPAGAIGIAASRTGVYPFASPGGWNLVANAIDFHAFDPARGAALRPGDRVRFEPR
ncbi:MAG: carboxyltransferase domain-containing protein [Pseudomonadota bacterium]|nr:carboxyltransferase domain-containing protein [Pseudomonadota bacterium]